MKNLSKFISTGITTEGEGGVCISVLEDPKEVLIAPGNSSFLNNLILDIQIMTAQSFGIELENQTDDGVRNHVVNVDALAFIHDNKKVLGFASAKIPKNENVFYLYGVAIAQEFKGKGGARSLVKALLNLGKFSKIVFTSQNPIMFCLLRSLCVDVYPSPDNNGVPDRFSVLGKTLLDNRPGKFNAKTLVINQLYGKCLYKTIPRCRQNNVNIWFDSSLNVQDGITRDAFLFIGEGIK